MTSLYLDFGESGFVDYHELALPSDFSFTFTRTNPYFEDGGGDSTLELTLPTVGDLNERLFDHVSRLDFPKERKSWPYRLVVDNEELSVGLARLTSVTDVSVGLQLLGGSAGNSEVDFDKLYLDEVVHHDLVNAISRGAHGNITYLSYRGTHGLTEHKCNLLFPMSSLGNYDYFTLPVYNETLQKVYNKPYFARCRMSDSFDYFYEQQTRRIPAQTYDPSYVDSDATNRRLSQVAFQPSLKTVVVLTFKCLGYRLHGEAVFERNEHSVAILAALYLAHANYITDVCDCLPHITLSEFFKQIGFFFNCFLDFDHVNKVCTLRPRLDYLSTSSDLNPVCLVGSVVDDYSVSLDNEDIGALDDNNLPLKYHGVPKGENLSYGLSYPDHWVHYLGDGFRKYIREDAIGQKRLWHITPSKVAPFGLIGDLLAFCAYPRPIISSRGWSPDPSSRYYFPGDTSSRLPLGKTSLALGGIGFPTGDEVDLSSPSSGMVVGKWDARDPMRAADNTLSLKPSMLHYYTLSPDASGDFGADLQPFTADNGTTYNSLPSSLLFDQHKYLCMPTVPIITTDDSTGECMADVCMSNLAPDDQVKDADFHLAFANCSAHRLASEQSTFTATYLLAFGDVHTNLSRSLGDAPLPDGYEPFHLLGRDCSFSLRPTRESEHSVYNAWFNPGEKGETVFPDSDVEHCVSFLDPITQPRGLFVIRGRMYMCSKIELTITAEGFSPLKKGYFRQCSYEAPE